MQAGKLRHRIELQDYEETVDSVGQPIKEWETYDTVWADIQTLSGRELLHAQQVSAEIVSKITIRYNSAVRAKHKVKFGTRIFEIYAVINAEEQEIYQRLLCKEIVD